MHVTRQHTSHICTSHTNIYVTYIMHVTHQHTSHIFLRHPCTTVMIFIRCLFFTSSRNVLRETDVLNSADCMATTWTASTNGSRSKNWFKSSGLSDLVNYTVNPTRIWVPGAVFCCHSTSWMVRHATSKMRGRNPGFVSMENARCVICVVCSANNNIVNIRTQGCEQHGWNWYRAICSWSIIIGGYFIHPWKQNKNEGRVEVMINVRDTGVTCCCMTVGINMQLSW